MRKLVSAWWKRFGLAAGLLGLWVLGVSVTSAPGVQAAQKHPRPTGQELAKAEKVVQEVFGRDIQKAQTPRQKADLAREILGRSVQRLKRPLPGGPDGFWAG